MVDIQILWEEIVRVKDQFSLSEFLGSALGSPPPHPWRIYSDKYIIIMMMFDVVFDLCFICMQLLTLK